MGRHARKPAETGFYHIMARGNNKNKVFHQRQDFIAFLDRLSFCLSESDVSLYHFCLMTNHYHLLLKAYPIEHLSQFVHRLHRFYFHYYRQNFTYFGHLFQGRFKSIPIHSDAQLLECGRYIERNPVRAGLVKHPADWDYSSFNFYVDQRKQKPSWLSLSPAYLGLAYDEEMRATLYEARVIEERAYEAIVDKHLIRGKF